MRRVKAAVLATIFALGAGACSDPMGPDGAELQVAAHGDASAASYSKSSTEPTYSQSFTSADGSAEGTVHFRARVWVRSSANQWIELTQGAAQSAAVDASGRQGARAFVNARTQVGSYNRVRVEFEDVRANVTGGLQIGTGLLTGEVRVDLGGSEKVVVERSIDLRTSLDGSATLVLDLNSGAWLHKARREAQAQTVNRAEFESAVRVFVN